MSLTTVIERSKTDREAWKYTNLAPLAAQKFVPFASNAAHQVVLEKLPTISLSGHFLHRMVFVNGVLRGDLSHLGRLPEGVLEANNSSEGYRLQLEAQTCLIADPIEFIHIYDASQPAETSTQIDINLGANCRLTLIEHHITSANKQPIVNIHETKIHLGPQAKLVHGKLVDTGDAVTSLARTDVTIEEGAYYDNFALIKSGKLVRNEIEAKLAGKLAQCALNTVMLLRGSIHADTTTQIRHEAPFCSSRQICKSVIAEKAHGVFQGGITVAEGAQKTDAQQLSRALLLSDQAEMDAKPELKIYADDVKCSHGASIGALDENAMFYLRSRGLNEQEARALLIRGFAGEILDEIHVPEWRDYARREVEVWCDEQN